MKKVLILLLALTLIGGFAGKSFADDDDWDDDDFKHWKYHGDYNRLHERRYKHWHNHCERRYGRGCSYATWRVHIDWDDDDWEDYWYPKRHHDYEKIERVNRRVNIIHNVLDASRSLLWW